MITTQAIRVELDMRIESLANARLHHFAKARKVKAQREHAGLMLLNRVDDLSLPCAITLTRIAPREFDSDNLRSAFKAVRDGIADVFGVKDNDPRIDWQYAQRKGAPKQYAAEVVIECVSPSKV